MSTVQILYQAQLLSLVKRRAELIEEIESINSDIETIKAEALKDAVHLDNIG